MPAPATPHPVTPQRNRPWLFHHAMPSEASAREPSSVPDTPGSQLFVGPNIKLRGVEISDCDVLIVEGHVEATIHSKAMQIAKKPGTLKGAGGD